MFVVSKFSLSVAAGFLGPPLTFMSTVNIILENVCSRNGER